MNAKSCLIILIFASHFYLGCGNSNVESHSIYHKGISEIELENGLMMDSLPDGTLISKGLKKDGLKEGEWEYFDRKKSNEATIKVYSSDSLIGEGFIRWHSEKRSQVDLKSISYYFPKDTCERNWGFTREGIHKYYSASWKSSKVDTVVFLRAEGDTATFSTAKNGTVIKSWRR